MMAVWGIRSYASLSALLRDHGHEFKSDTLRNWLTGRTSVHHTFPPALVEALRLDEGERARLADAFTYREDERP
jgi:hypothetical protein